MCHKECECPMYEYRKAHNLKGACDNCEYIIRMKRLSKYSKIALAVAVVLFVVTSYLLF